LIRLGAPPYDPIVQLRRRLLVVLTVFGLGAVAPTTALAQEVRAVPSTTTGTPHAISEYGGVTPGVSHPPPRAGRLASRRGRAARAQIITWPGFQSLGGGASRFFVETTGPVTTEIHASEGRVEIVFHETTIHLTNSRRWLETQFFETPVVRARLERRRRDMVLVMQLRAGVTPTVSQSTDASGYHFTYIDFAGGHYLPDAPITVPQPPPRRDESGRASVRPATPESEASYPTRADDSMDDERPPPVETQ
jgi:hypothetical protein